MTSKLPGLKLSELILFENEYFVALNKPSGILSIPDREGKQYSLKELLREKYGNVYTIHRLDRETSGLIIFAKTAEAHRHFSLQFEERKTVKIYHGLLIGTLSEKKGSINLPIAENRLRRGTMLIHQRGKPALTDFEVVQDFGYYSWVQFRIHTGRTHQIRVHAKELGHPIVCDTIYGDGKPFLLSGIKPGFHLSKKEEEEKPMLNRLGLHASTLVITDVNDRQIKLEAPLHKDLKATLRQLEKRRNSLRIH
jgi:23S rRNA pseudouridine955/2504/2580 synthase/23S rRNA pseudouridine1911/1915/1917 synthase